MAGYVIVGLGISIVLMIISILGPIIGYQLEPVTGITVDATPLTLYFFVFATIYNGILLSVIALNDRGKETLEEDAEEHLFTLMIPCRNEAAVIEQTIRAFMRVDYSVNMLEVLAINDGSEDDTGAIVRKLIYEFPNLKLLNILPHESGQGKSSALNRGFAYLQEKSIFRESPNWIIGVIDADGVVDHKILKKSSHRFKDDEVGAVQILVRIGNAKDSVLTMLQDIEFVTFAKVTQFARSIFKGAVALGGNGQFIRASTLKSIAISPREYWKVDALTEDLDLGTRVLLNNWHNSFLSSTCVYQQGVTTLSALYKQRTRWSWGALQCFFNYAASFKVLGSGMKIMKKFDLLYYLSAAILPPAILLVWTFSILGLLGVFHIYNPFPSYFMIANSICFFPLVGYGLWTVRQQYKARMIIPLLFLTNAYTYHWVICTLRAMIHMLKRDKPKWMVTKKTKVDYQGIAFPRAR